MSFQDRVVWITGASSGIGEALAKEVAKDRPRLVLSGRRTEELERVAQETGLAESDRLILPFDVTDEAAQDEAVARVRQHFGRVDLLVNNAGLSQRARILETEMSAYRKLMEVDFFAQIALTKRVLPIMLEQGDGHIAVTSSVSGKLGSQGRAGYCAAKHAIMGFFDALRAEHAADGIAVSTIVPGYIKTPIAYSAVTGDGSAYGQMRAGNAKGLDVGVCARCIAAGLRRRQSEIPVGRGLEMHALWLKRFFPGLVFKMVERIKE